MIAFAVPSALLCECLRWKGSAAQGAGVKPTDASNRSPSRSPGPAVRVQLNTIGLLNGAVARFNSQGFDCRRVMTGNGPASVSALLTKASSVLGLRNIPTGPGHARNHGKAEKHGLRPTASTSRAVPASIVPADRADHVQPEGRDVFERCS